LRKWFVLSPFVLAPKELFSSPLTSRQMDKVAMQRIFSVYASMAFCEPYCLLGENRMTSIQQSDIPGAEVIMQITVRAGMLHSLIAFNALYNSFPGFLRKKGLTTKKPKRNMHQYISLSEGLTPFSPKQQGTCSCDFIGIEVPVTP
jgi:hypothetical protein